MTNQQVHTVKSVNTSICRSSHLSCFSFCSINYKKKEEKEENVHFKWCNTIEYEEA